MTFVRGRGLLPSVQFRVVPGSQASRGRGAALETTVSAGRGERKQTNKMQRPPLVCLVTAERM